jgi:hypothetical protein
VKLKCRADASKARNQTRGGNSVRIAYIQLMHNKNDVMIVETVV